MTAKTNLEHLKQTGRRKQIVLSRKNVFDLGFVKFSNKTIGKEIIKYYERELKKRFVSGDSYDIILNDGHIKTKNVITLRLVQKDKELKYIKQQEKRYNKVFTAEEILKPIVAMSLRTMNKNLVNQVPLRISTQTDFRQELIKLTKLETDKFEKL